MNLRRRRRSARPLVTLADYANAGYAAKVTATTDDGSDPYDAMSGRLFEAGSSLIYAAPAGLGAACTIACCYTPTYAGTDTTGERNIVTLFQASGQRVTLFRGSDKKFKAIFLGTGGSLLPVEALAQTWSANSRHVLVACFTGGSSATGDLNHDGTDVTQKIGAVTVTDPTTIVIGGATSGATAVADGRIKSVIVSPTNKGATWATAIQASIGAAYNDPVALFSTYMAVGDYIFPLTADAVGYRKLA